MRILTVVILLLLVWPAAPAPAEDPAPLVARLASDDLAQRVEAAQKLAAMGDPARLALERLLHPAGAAPSGTKRPDEQLRARIDALIVRLGAAQYKVREGATRELVRIGRPATAQLRLAQKSADLEVRQRATRILDTLYPPVEASQADLQKVEAAALLGLVGTRQSIPALRQALSGGGPRLAAAAAGALRAITGGGPSDDPQRWKAQRAKLLGEWEAVLDALPAAPAGEAVTLDPRYPKGTMLEAGTSNQVKLVFDLSKLFAQMGGQAPPGIARQMRMKQTGQAAYRVKIVRRKPLAVSWRFSEHRSVTEQGAIGGGGGPRKTEQSWKGKELVLEVDKAGKLQLTMDDKPLPATANGPMLQMGLLLALDLPRGEYRPGQGRPLGKPFFDRLTTMVFATSPRKGASFGEAGKLTYLGKNGGVDRYFLVARFAHRGPGKQMMQMTLQGPLLVDPARGIVTRYDLAGPLIGSFGAGGKQKMMAEGYWTTTYRVK